PSPINQRVATSDVVVVGKVLRLEEKPVSAKPYPTSPMPIDYTIAVVQIQEGLLGADKMKEVRVGFIVPKNVPNPGPAIRPIGPRAGNIQLVKDQEYALFLTKHADGDFYTAVNYFDVIQKNNPTFAKDMEQARKQAKLIADPMGSLKSKDV